MYWSLPTTDHNSRLPAVRCVILQPTWKYVMPHVVGDVDGYELRTRDLLVSSNDGSQQSFTSSAVCDTPANVEVRDAACGPDGYELRTRDLLVSSNDGSQQSFTSSAVCDTPANVEVRDAACGRDGEYQMRTRNRQLYR
jgi:hypothetical protein